MDPIIATIVVAKALSKTMQPTSEVRESAVNAVVQLCTFKPVEGVGMGRTTKELVPL